MSTRYQRKQDNSIKEKTSDELLEEIAVNKRKLKQGFVFAFVALIAVIALGIAWFMSNSKVTSTGTSVSAQDDRLFELASVGGRQTAEASYLKDESKKNILSAGLERTYASYIENGSAEGTNISCRHRKSCLVSGFAGEYFAGGEWETGVLHNP